MHKFWNLGLGLEFQVSVSTVQPDLGLEVYGLDYVTGISVVWLGIWEHFVFL